MLEFLLDDGAELDDCEPAAVTDVTVEEIEPPDPGNELELVKATCDAVYEDVAEVIEPPERAGLVDGCVVAPLDDEVDVDDKTTVLLEDEDDEDVKDVLDEL